MADTPAQASLRAAFDSKLSVIPQTLNSGQQTQAQTNMGGPFLPLTGGTVAGTITATGFSGPLTGNASTASAWATPITMTVSGDATGSVSIDGSDNATLNLAIANSSVTNAMLAASSVTFSKVASGDVATQAEAESGTANNSFMTPLRVAQAIAAQIPPAVPTGMIAFFDLTEVPDGWLVCDGSAVSRKTYANLFAKIGTRHGAGNGSTTFNLPDMDARFLEGTTTTADVGKKLEAGLPNIIGEFGASKCDDQVISGAFKRDTNGWGADGGQASASKFSFDASRCSAIYQAITTVQPASLCLIPCIKI